jgi:hypothetical protein
MKAAVYRTYGPRDVVKIENVDKPKPTKNEVLIKIHGTTVSSADWRVRSLVMPKGFGQIARPVFGLFGPRQPILGSELAGEIDAVGVNSWPRPDNSGRSSIKATRWKELLRRMRVSTAGAKREVWSSPSATMIEPEADKMRGLVLPTSPPVASIGACRKSRRPAPSSWPQRPYRAAEPGAWIRS